MWDNLFALGTLIALPLGVESPEQTRILAPIESIPMIPLHLHARKDDQERGVVTRSHTCFVPLAMSAAFTLSSDAQDNMPKIGDKAALLKEKEKDKDKDKENPRAPGLYREFSGVIQLGNYDTKPQKKNPERFTLNVDGKNGIESMKEYYTATEAKTPYHGRHRLLLPYSGTWVADSATVSARACRAALISISCFEKAKIGRAAVLPRTYFLSGASIRSAKYLFSFQVVAFARVLIREHQMSEGQLDLVRKGAIRAVMRGRREFEPRSEKFAARGKGMKLQNKQSDPPASPPRNCGQQGDAKAMLPDDAIEDIPSVFDGRSSMWIACHISVLLGYFDNAAFARSYRT